MADPSEPGALTGRLERLLDSRAHVEETDRIALLAALAPGVAHDINNPLTFIQANLQNLRNAFGAFEAVLDEKVPRDDPTRRAEGVDDWSADLGDILSEMEEGSRRIQGLTRVLRQLTREPADDPEVLDVASVVRDAVTFASYGIKRYATLSLDLHDTPPLEGSRTRLTHLVLSLVVRAAELWGGTVRVRTEGLQDNVLIEVSNAQVMDAQSVQEADEEPSLVTRLGLRVCRRIVTDHGGSLGVHTDPGGTRFSAILPSVLAEQVPVEETTSEDPDTSDVARVLFIDDEPLAIRSFTRIWAGRLEVIGADGGEAALALLAEDRAFEAILCDVSMPPPNGLEVYHLVEARHPELIGRFAFVTAGVSDPQVREAIEALGVPVFGKPYDLTAIGLWLAGLG